MKPGDLVQFTLDSITGNAEFGIVLRELSYDERRNDPFMHVMVLFQNRGVLQCRVSDLCHVHEKSFWNINDNVEEQ